MRDKNGEPGLCHDTYNSTSMKNYFDTKCLNKANCNIKGLKTFLKGTHSGSCSDREAHFFI